MSKDKECFVPCTDQAAVGSPDFIAIAGRLASLEARVSGNGSLTDNRIAELEGQISSLVSEVDGLEAEVAELRAVVAAMDCVSHDVGSESNASSGAVVDALQFLRSFTADAGHDRSTAASLWCEVLKKI